MHRFWIGDPRPQHLWITLVVAQSQPDLIDWTWDSLPKELTSQLDPNDDPRHLSNLVRYWLLYEYGGLYLDSDVIPLRNLTGAPNPWTASLRGRREGSVLWFPNPGHLLLKQMFSYGMTASLVSSPVRSGAKVLDILGRKHPDVWHEPRVLPIDALGLRVNVKDVWAIGQWQTSSRNIKEKR